MSRIVLTHPRGLVDSDVDGEAVVGRQHGRDGRRGVGHADPVGDAARRDRDRGQELEKREKRRKFVQWSRVLVSRVGNEPACAVRR